MTIAASLVDPDLAAFLFLIALVITVVVLIMSRATALLAWACLLALIVLTWNAAVVAGWL